MSELNAQEILTSFQKEWAEFKTSVKPGVSAEDLEQVKADFTKTVEDKIDAKLEQKDAQARIVAASGVDEVKAERYADFVSYLRTGIATKSVVQDATGQKLVPEELDAEFYRTLANASYIRQLGTVRPAITNAIRKRDLEALTVSWGKIESGAALTEDTMTPSDSTIYVENLYGLTKFSVDELNDVPGLESLIMQEFAGLIGAAEDSAALNGVGHTSGQPMGILVDTGVTAVDSSGHAITIAGAKKVVWTLNERYRPNASWVFNSNTALALDLEANTNSGQFLWNPDSQQNTWRARLLGYPVTIIESAPTLSAGAHKVAAFGDFKQALRIYDNGGITLKRIVELYAEDDLVGFIGKKRTGMGVVVPNAVKTWNIVA